MAGPVLISSANYVDTHAQMQQLSAMVLLQEFLGWLSKNCDENPRMRNIFNSKSPPKGRACADSRRNFWTTNLKTPVSSHGRLVLTTPLFLRR